MSKHGKGKRPIKQRQGAGAPQRNSSAPPTHVPEEIRGVITSIQEVVREDPGGWSTVAEVLRGPEIDAEVILDFMARNLGKESLPLLKGLALDDDDLLAESALKALPLLGSRAAGDALVEAYAAHPEGERARLAWQGVEALRGRGINVAVPEPGGVRVAVPQFQVREYWESVSDGVGTREMIARAQDRYGVWHSVVVIWNDRAGVKDGLMGPLSQKDWREMMQDHAREEIQVAQVPPDFARWQVGRVRLLNEKTGFPLEEKLQNWDAIVGPPAPDYEPPDPLADLRGRSPEELKHLQGHLGCLFHMPAFKTWAIEPADCKGWWEAWNELDESKPEAEQVAEADALLAQVANHAISAETVALYRERMIDTSRKLRWLRHDHEADIAAAVALELENVEQPGDHTLFRYLAGNGLEMLGEILEAGDDPEKLRYDPMGTEELAQHG